jgi:predicted alpha/beta-fold hydrolase
LLQTARSFGWGADMLIFRGCGDELNRAPRFYHSGETGDLEFVVARILEEFPDAPMVVCGVSLGGNVLLKWLGQWGDELDPRVRGAAALSVPFDLERGSRYISRGFSRVYERHFLRTLRKKAAAKLTRYPALFDLEAMLAARTLYEFDDVVTAPIHGFRDAHDYYSQSSSLPYLSRIRRPTLLLSARDDPFLPAAVLDEVAELARDNSCLTAEFHEHGGHVGFVSGRPWRPVYYAERRVGEFLRDALDLN